MNSTSSLISKIRTARVRVISRDLAELRQVVAEEQTLAEQTKTWLLLDTAPQE